MTPARITSFLVKIASRCNLDCDYCYVYHHADQSWRSMPQYLTEQDRSHFAARLAEYVRDAEIPHCVVIFHGGEPLLFGSDAIVSFVKEIRAAVRPETTISFGMQTNGLLLTDEALEALSAANVAISLSLDGPKEVNDLHRSSRKGRSSFAKTAAALERLKQAPKTFAGIIAVIDPTIRPRILFEFFDRHNPPKLDFLLPDAHHLRPPPGRDDNPTVYADWLVEAFDVWLDDFPHLPVRMFEAMLDTIAGLPGSTDAFGFGDVSLLTIETDGTYHDLDVLKVVGDGATRLSGSVRDTPIAAILSADAIAAHRKLLSKDGLSATCQNCDEVDACGGGSLPHRYGANGFANPTIYCDEMQMLFAHIRSRLQGHLAKPAQKSEPLPTELDPFRYELAEQSSDIVERLWADASHSALTGLKEALRVFAQKSDAARALLGMADNSLRNLATRPGTIAWQRAVASTYANRAVHAVDGQPLRPDLTYVDFLLEKSRKPQLGIEVADHDVWLRLPFGSSILFEANDVTLNAGPVVASALDLINRWRPDLYREMTCISRAIQFVRDPTAHSDKIVSFSDNAVPGALFVSVTQGRELIDPFDLADSLVHEHRHQKLYLLERLFPMVEPTTMWVKSPWREDPRPPSGLLHAIFVFVELQRFWMHVQDQGPGRLQNRAVNQLKDTAERLREGFDILRSCPLTPAGQALAAVLEERAMPASQTG